MCLTAFCLCRALLSLCNAQWVTAPYPRGRARRLARLSRLSEAAQSCPGGSSGLLSVSGLALKSLWTLLAASRRVLARGWHREGTFPRCH